MEFASSLTLLDSDTPFLLEKRIALLKAIDIAGSISKAAKMVPMSYKAAWDAIDSINNLCPHAVVSKETGGVGGGGAKLTPYGINLVNTYELLQEEHKKFLQNLSKNTDFDKGTLKSLQRFSMNISARNQIHGKVELIESGKVNAQVYIKLKSGYTIVSVITNSAVKELELDVGDDVSAIFKSSSVMLSTDNAISISARNKFRGTIDSIQVGEVSSEVVVGIGNNDKLVAVITSGSLDRLGLKEGKEVSLIIKSSDVMVGK
ncbi:MAG: TOBE domain-containing protein [Campylobacterales bacterium]|nr:TOBE domain-containing protein [Campylobacterales bacterium]